MARIAAVEAWGYQSLFDCRFILAPNGLTVITGPNDSGKTALIRIIRWIALGEPQGDDFLYTVYDELDKTKIVEQAEEAGGRLHLDNGVTITKVRRKGETTWLISSEPEPYKKAAVPEVVTSLTGLTVTNFSDFEVALNFAYQLDPPFMLSESPSAGAKVLGKLAGTEVVDLALKDVAKDVSKHQTARRNAEQEMGAKELELMNYQG
ncbi:MAG: AAA family ATPase, partial [Carboxydocellales bacterium]